MGASSVKCEGRNKIDCANAWFKHSVNCHWINNKCVPPAVGRADLHLNSRVEEVMETFLNNKWDKDESSNI